MSTPIGHESEDCLCNLYDYGSGNILFQSIDTKNWGWRYLNCLSQAGTNLCNDSFFPVNVGNNSFVAQNYNVQIVLPSSKMNPQITINGRRIGLPNPQVADIRTIGWNLDNLPSGICPLTMTQNRGDIVSNSTTVSSLNPTQQFWLYALIAIVVFFIIIAVLSYLTKGRGRRY